MSTPMFSKMQINGYQVINVNNGPWTVCTKEDRLGSFGSRQEALAYAVSLPANPSRVQASGRKQ
ncbi:DUF2188 domain-containing protein [Pseudomonas sp. DWP3-1-2]|uniref:DUF2188 domain-containing protein n=1 Tax=Pseudomonas sp. DWP3-1-2 TaxID=2804645 RepID=UPI003CF1A898